MGMDFILIMAILTMEEVIGVGIMMDIMPEAVVITHPMAVIIQEIITVHGIREVEARSVRVAIAVIHGLAASTIRINIPQAIPQVATTG
jgi:hypothetical protein